MTLKDGIYTTGMCMLIASSFGFLVARGAPAPIFMRVALVVACTICFPLGWYLMIRGSKE